MILTTARLTAIERQEPSIIPVITVSGCMGGNGNASTIHNIVMKYVVPALDCGSIGY